MIADLNNHREWAAVGLSLVLHLAAVRLLILTFPVMPGMPNPSLTFLGALLDRQDVARKPFPTKPLPEKKAGAEAPVTFESSVFNPARSVIGKPSYTQDLRAGSRITLKSPPQEDASTPFDTETIAAEMGVNFKLPRYEPLRLRIEPP